MSGWYSFLRERRKTIEIVKREVQVKGQMVHYQVVGQGEPIILIHGLSGSSRWWVRNVPSLAEHYQVYLIDLPGFGMMHRFHGRFALDEASTWVMVWMNAVGISRAHLIGHSMGGYIGIWLAANQPEIVDHLVLVSPAGIPRVRSLLGYAIPLVVALRYLTPSFFPILLYDALRAGPLTLLRAAQDLLTKDVRDCLHEIVAPTLLIWGEDDSLVPPSLGDILHKEIAHSQFMVLKKAGHVGMFDQPQRFNAAVLTFLAEEPQRPLAKIAEPPPPVSEANYSLHHELPYQ